MMRTIDQVGQLQRKTVFMRADFDVPVVDGKISEPFRIEKQKVTLRYLLDHGARVALASHISAIPSFEPIKPQLEQLLGVTFGDDVKLLENTRANPGEQTNDESFARELVAGCDLYVNNAFAVCHRAHASVSAAAKLLPAYAGLLVQEETQQLQKVIDAPAEGKVIFMGGAKVETKMPTIQFLLDKAEAIAIGGKIANEMPPTTDSRLRLPTDFAEDKLDIGPETAHAFAALTKDTKLIVWNGPMGKFEDARFMAGTKAVAEAIANSSAWTVIGGGDTIAAVNQLGLLGKFSFVSTGGGAMLAFLAGQRLPGLEVLGYYLS
jgi:phosphoglycerate kinase